MKPSSIFVLALVILPLAACDKIERERREARMTGQSGAAPAATSEAAPAGTSSGGRSFRNTRIVHGQHAPE